MADRLALLRSWEGGTSTPKAPLWGRYGCRRELLESAVSGGVRVFSATELMLGLSAATRARASPLRLAAPVRTPAPLTVV